MAAERILAFMMVLLILSGAWETYLLLLLYPIPTLLMVCLWAAYMPEEA